MKLSQSRPCGLVVEARVSPRRQQGKPVYTNTQEKNVLDSIHHQGWHAVAFIVRIAGCFSHVYFMVQARNQTVRQQSTFTRGVRFMGSLVQSDGEVLLLTVEVSCLQRCFRAQQDQ